MKNSITKFKRLWKLTLFLLIVFIIGIVLTLSAYLYFNVLDYQEFDTAVFINNGSVGLNSNTDALNFGKCNPGGGVIKYVDISSKEPALLKIYISGNISNMVSYEGEPIVLEPNITRTIVFNLDAPKNISLGSYTGKVRILFLKE